MFNHTLVYRSGRGVQAVRLLTEYWRAGVSSPELQCLLDIVRTLVQDGTLTGQSRAMVMLTEMGPERNSAQQWHEWLLVSLKPVEVT